MISSSRNSQAVRMYLAAISLGICLVSLLACAFIGFLSILEIETSRPIRWGFSFAFLLGAGVFIILIAYEIRHSETIEVNGREIGNLSVTDKCLYIGEYPYLEFECNSISLPNGQYTILGDFSEILSGDSKQPSHSDIRVIRVRGHESNDTKESQSLVTSQAGSVIIVNKSQDVLRPNLELLREAEDEAFKKTCSPMQSVARIEIEDLELSGILIASGTGEFELVTENTSQGCEVSIFFYSEES